MIFFMKNKFSKIQAFTKLMGKYLILSLLYIFYLLFFVAVPISFAAISCQPIYGGGQTCVSVGGITVDKTVINPQTRKMVDSLGINDPKFSANSIVTFQIALTNATDSLITHIDVKDMFPQFVNFNTGTGTFDPNNKTLTFGVDNLAANEKRVFTLVGKVVDINQLPAAQSITCVVNQVSATANQGATSQDNSQFCIQKKPPTPQVTKGGFPVLSPVPITTTPSTGPETLILFSLIPTSAIGLFLIKKAKEIKK